MRRKSYYQGILLKPILLFIFLFVYSFSYGQSDLISGVIIDLDTEEPIPFVSIAIPKKLIGTVTDSIGYFRLTSTLLTDEDSILISRLGYKSRRLSFKDFHDAKDRIFFLKQNSLELEEFTVGSKPIGSKRTIGVLASKSNFAFAFNPKNEKASDNFGREIAMEEDLKKKVGRIKAVRFSLGNNQLDFLLFRINVYKVGSQIGEEKIFESYVRVEDQKAGVIEIPLNEMNLELSGKFRIGIEFIDLKGENEFGVVTLPVRFPLGIMYFRNSSLGSWKKGRGSPSIQVEVETFD